MSGRRRAVTRLSPRHTLALALVAVLAAAGVGTAVLLPRTPAPTGAPAAGPALSTPPAAPAGSPARPLDDSFLDRDDDPVPTTPRTVDVADAGALTDALGSVRGGTTLVLADGTYDGDFTVRGVSATPEAPVVVRAANPGKAVIAIGLHARGQGKRARRRRRPDVPERREHPAQAGVVEQRARHAQHLRPGRRRRGLQQVALHRWRGQPPQPDRPQHLPEQDRPRQLPDARRLEDAGLPVRPDRPQPVR